MIRVEKAIVMPILLTGFLFAALLALVWVGSAMMIIRLLEGGEPNSKSDPPRAGN